MALYLYGIWPMVDVLGDLQDPNRWRYVSTIEGRILGGYPLAMVDVMVDFVLYFSG